MSAAEATQSDVVVSCRVRLARNFADQPFVNRATPEQCERVVATARTILVSDQIDAGMRFITFGKGVHRRLTLPPGRESGLGR